MLIALTGFISAGKDSITNFLVEDWGFERLSHATALKDGVATMFGLDREMLEGATEESRIAREQTLPYWTEKIMSENPTFLDGNVTGRGLLTDIGLLMRTHVCPSFWIYTITSKIKELQEQGKHVVVTDVRFANEVDNIRKLGGIVVRVRRGSDPEWFDKGIRAANLVKGGCRVLISDSDLPHISEWAWLSELDKIDHTIENSGTLEDLKVKLYGWMEDKGVPFASPSKKEEEEQGEEVRQHRQTDIVHSLVAHHGLDTPVGIDSLCDRLEAQITKSDTKNKRNKRQREEEEEEEEEEDEKQRLEWKRHKRSKMGGDALMNRLDRIADICEHLLHAWLASNCPSESSDIKEEEGGE